MKFAIVLFLVVYVTIAFSQRRDEIVAQWQGLVNPYKTECECATGVNQTMADRLFPNLELPNDACFKCYLRCLQDNLGYTNRDGSFNIVRISKTVVGFSPEITHDCLRNVVNETDRCQATYNFVVCAVNTVFSEISSSSQSERD